MRISKQLLILLIFISANGYAETPCRTLAKDMALDAPSIPLKADKDTQGQISALMHDLDILCKAIVKSIKVDNRTPEFYDGRRAEFLLKAKREYDKDGDMDKLEDAKFYSEFIDRSVKIAEQ